MRPKIEGRDDGDSVSSRMSVSPALISRSRLTDRKPALLIFTVCFPGFTSGSVNAVAPTGTPSSSTRAPAGEVVIFNVPPEAEAGCLGVSGGLASGRDGRARWVRSPASRCGNGFVFGCLMASPLTIAVAITTTIAPDAMSGPTRRRGRS